MTLVKIQSVFKFLSGSFIKNNLFLLLSNTYLFAILLLERLIFFSVFLWSFFLRSYASSGLAITSAGASKAFSVSSFNSVYSVPPWLLYLRSYASSGLAFFPLVRHYFISLFTPFFSVLSISQRSPLTSCFVSAGASKAFSVSSFNSVYSVPPWLLYLRSYASSGLAFFPLVRHYFISLFSPLCLRVLRASVVNNF